MLDPASGAVLRTCDFDKVNAENVVCRFPVEPGATVPVGTKLRLRAQRVIEDFVGWSLHECPGSGPCEIELEGNRSVQATFRRVTLSVRTAGEEGTVTSSPPGLTCDLARLCTGEFDAGTVVTLTGHPSNPAAPIKWSAYGCEPVDDQPPTGPTCVVPVINHFAAVAFGEAEERSLFPPFAVRIHFRVSTRGNGSISGPSLDCPGKNCAQVYHYGQGLKLTAQPAAGWEFKRWVGGCARNPCRLRAGPVTSVRAEFARPAQPLVARLSGVAVSGRKALRRVRVTVLVNKPALAAIDLSRRGRTLATRLKRLNAGRNTVVLAVPRRVRAGRYRLAITISDGGSRQSFARRVRLSR